MSQLGLGVMLKQMFGSGKPAEDFEKAKTKKISNVSADDGGLYIEFTDKSKLSFQDDGQSCCETRYSTSEEIKSFKGANITGADIAYIDDDSPDTSSEDCHEVCLLTVHTSKGDISVKFHNEHNGYYGGFYIACHLSGE